MRETISHTIIDSTDKYKHRLAYQMREGKRSLIKIHYEDVNIQAQRIASFLDRKGIKAQEPIGIYAPNSPQWAIAFAGIMFNNGIAVPIDYNSGSAELQHIIDDTGIRCIFTTHTYAGRLDRHDLQYIVVMDEDEERDWDRNGRQYSLAAILGQSTGSWTVPRVQKQDAAVIIYTSGTTAVPKGVVLTHEGLLSNVHAIIDALEISENDKFLSVIGLSHTFELSCGLILPLCVGASVTYNTNLKYTTIFKDMAFTHPTVILAVPMLFKILLEHAIARATSAKEVSLGYVEETRSEKDRAVESAKAIFGGALRFCISGGAPLAVSLIKGYEGIGIPMLQVYGLTEVSGVATLTPVKPTDLNSVGTALPHVDVTINANHESEPGEVWLRGTSMMKGYNNNPQATKDSIQNGWLHTGDIGYLDKRGSLFICGRSKNVIVTSAGVKVHPEELEQRIQASRYVTEVCVLGKQRPDGTETVHALVVPEQAAYKLYREDCIKEKASFLELHELILAEIAGLTSDLASYKKIHSMQIRNKPLPRGRTRKIMRELVKREINTIQSHQ
jgi:long-chain acyl-CoA synthetase